MYIKKIVHQDQMGFIPQTQGWFNINKSINAINHVVKKDKTVPSQQIQTKSFNKTLIKMGINRIYLNIIKTIYEKSTANNILLVKSCREGNGNPLQYSCLENPMDRGAW